MTFDGETFRTVAAESPDALKVRDSVARLGLLECENISYVTANKRIRAGSLT